MEAKLCPDGTAVGRNPAKNREFDECPKVPINNLSIQCSTDNDCLLIDRDVNFKACWPVACLEVDYSLDKWIAVNKNSFETFKLQQAGFRPSDCGPDPGCPIKLINDNYEARCIDKICKKLPICIPEGESYAVVPGAKPCCEGLTAIGCSKPDANNNCPPACVGASYCTKCGDGVCDARENKCNCPADCK
ncbi:MAG: hypothetical protein AB1467_03360 [Candidatus Diapherotrites archaeon]